LLYRGFEEAPFGFAQGRLKTSAVPSQALYTCHPEAASAVEGPAGCALAKKLQVGSDVSNDAASTIFARGKKSRSLAPLVMTKWKTQLGTPEGVPLQNKKS